MQRDTPHALVIDDDPDSLSGLADLVQLEGFSVDTAANLAEARHNLAENKPDLILSDLMLPDGRGIELLEETSDDPSTEFILVTGQATVETAVLALRLGAFDYLTKPVNLSRLKTLVAGFYRNLGLKEEIVSLRGELRKLGRFGDMVGSSPAMQKVYTLIERVAPTQASVMVVGESGTGKELVAQTVHRLSKRRDAEFLAINCGAIAESLIESELFGHEKGSFTGADRLRKGYFEQANGGTLFLDEITEMPIELQVKLLRVLETGKLRRVGGVREVDADVRVVAATNRDPAQAVADGKLREDLYYRLKVFPIDLPPLRRRGDDVIKLALYFLDMLNRKEQTSKVLNKAALDKLKHYTWPGNVRELRNVVQRAHILADDEIGGDSVPLEPVGDGPAAAGGPVLQVRVGSSIAHAEKRLIMATLEEFEQDKRRSADILGVSLKTLYNRLNAYAAEDEAAAER